MDACASNRVVVGLGAGDDDFLAVRAGPGAGHAKIDRLHNGDAVFVCTGAGAWDGIVYGGAARFYSCGLEERGGTRLGRSVQRL